MTKLNISQFLRNYPETGNSFIYPKLVIDSVLEQFLIDLQNHTGTFIIDSVEYDSMVYTGGDNVYFSKNFNYITGKAQCETMFLLPLIKISKSADMIIVIESNVTHEMRLANEQESITTDRRYS